MRRAGGTALVLFAVAVTLALLLAVLSHQTWPPVLVSILLGVPALYLAWPAVPGVRPPEPAAEKSARGRPAARWDPVELGVHQVIGGAPMPVYIRRPHDELLRAVLDPAVPTSRLVVVRGGSSTGKTRAAYEAVADRLAGWQLDYPLNVAALAERLDAGIPARTVLWLGELRQYADAKGGPEVLGRLADLLDGDGPLLITSMWPEQWAAYTGAARAGPGAADPTGTAGRLLARLPEITGSDPARIDPARGGAIDVPARFTAAEMATAARTGDPVLAEAAAAACGARQDGQVTQYLAGVPDLLRRYSGPGGDPYGQAIITAAMDATRLGHTSPLPTALLLDAAIGYLTGPQRTKDVASWRDTALAWAAEELNGAVRALAPVPPVTGTGVVGYQVADYLDQHGRRTRQEQLGPPSLWDSLTTHAATAQDRTRLGQAGQGRGLYRHAAALWTTAATLGSADAAAWLITLLHQMSPGDTTRAARWAASHVSLDEPRGAALLEHTLRTFGADDAVTTLLARDPASQPSPDPRGEFFRQLDRDYWLFRAAGPGDVITVEARRVASQASLDDPEDVARLLQKLRDMEADDAVTTLLARDPASQVRIDDPQAVCLLLRVLNAAEADDAVTTLLARLPELTASQARLDDPLHVARLLQTLHASGGGDAVTTLARRVASQATLDDPQDVRLLLQTLRTSGGSDAVTTLLARDPASRVRIDDPQDVRLLLRVLNAAGADDDAVTLARRAANTGMFDLFRKFCPGEAFKYEFGREPDGTSSQPWGWQQPDELGP